MAEYSAEQMVRMMGKMRIKNISGAPLTLSGYGGYKFAVDEELDLLAPGTPAEIQAGSYFIAMNMVGRATVGYPPMDTTYELAKRIEDGELAVIEDVKGDDSVELQDPEGVEPSPEGVEPNPEG